jgi:hypothetical protein
MWFMVRATTLLHPFHNRAVDLSRGAGFQPADWVNEEE